MQILNFKGPQESVDCLYKESKLDKSKNIIIKDYCCLVYDQLKNNLSETFSNFFTLNAQLHKHSTRKGILKDISHIPENYLSSLKTKFQNICGKYSKYMYHINIKK